MFAKPHKQTLEVFENLRLPMHLQYFADPEGEGDTGDSEPDTAPSLDELLKDPEFKKQYEERFNKGLKKRLKKYEGVDVEEYKRLKEEANKDGSDNDEEKGDETDSKLNEHEKRLARAERREKRAAIKEYSIEKGVNPKLAAKLIDIDSIEMDEDGEPTNIEELFEELEEEFPEFFKGQQEEEDTGTQRGYFPGATQKGNSGTKGEDSYDVGKSVYARIREKRYPKKGE
ncbi:phage scaffolding protein [Shouchella tritolerans]|uniref:phage scaffolding protein n=1 Tax=Shouchella tritolerans TaxID=2979466 RepID=UPI0021E9488B|nr:hypothetical protein [Shouchella tritolerans]